MKVRPDRSCPQLLSSGRCSDRNCGYNHNIPVCDACCIVFNLVLEYEQHCVTRKHLKKISRPSAPGVLWCPLCKRVIQAASWNSHKKGRPHKANASSFNVSPNIQPETDIPHEILETHNFCAYCQIYVLLEAWGRHARKKKHKNSEKYTAFKMAQGEAEKDQNDVTIRGDLDFGIVEPAIAALGITRSIEVRATAPLAKITLVSVKLSADLGSSTKRAASPFDIAFNNRDLQLSAVRPIKINVTFKQEYIGRYQDRLEVQFEDSRLRMQFGIAKTVHVIVGDASMHAQLRPKAPYIPRVRAPREPETRVIEGVPPPSLNAITYVSRLPKADIPGHLLSALTVSSTPSKKNVDSIQHAFLPGVLDADSHGRHFKTLLWIEEHKMEEDLERYDMVETTLGYRRPYYLLEVPGLAEKRPSVLIGDRILARRTGGEQGHWFEGHVHFINQREVGLRFHGLFGGWTSTQKYHVRFKLNRIPSRRQHQALDTAFTQSRILFPDSSHLPMAPIPSPNFTPVNALVSGNPAQLQAVGSIMEAPPGSLPFIVFGPPGTGKTVTMVEAIKQLLKKDPGIKILACAPSNSAADIIAQRLLDAVNTNEMFRLYAPSRHRAQVPDELEPYTYHRDDGQNRHCFGVRPLAIMKTYKVIVSTCISASILPGIGITRGHFSHIFIDEAGQATEPEVFVSIKMMTDTATNVVLSGDPKQLGPVIRSGIARELGLEISYLERMVSRPPYELSIGTGKSIIKLLKNFRSHENILSFPNNQFYRNDLQPSANAKIVNAYLRSSYLPNKRFPVVFHSVTGKDDREASSPSFFNVDEILQVKTYIQQLKADRQFKTRDQDIGVITPYHAQCLKIRSALRSFAAEVKVGSVEEFQGQERTVIIISTVRSSKEFVSYDVKHTLGFVASPRRFNVSVTRAKALLIVVGDPNVLGLDPLWRLFLNYIYLNSGWKGPTIPWHPTEPVDQAGMYDLEARENAEFDMNEFTRRMEALTIGGADEDLDAGVDRPWRELE